MGAIGQWVGVILRAVAITETWVQALSPGLIEQFNQAFRDLQATMGVAFQGIFAEGIGFFKTLAAEIAPIFRDLKPIIDQLVNGVFKTLISAVQSSIPIYQSLLPVLSILASALDLVLAPVRVMVAAFQAFTTIALLPVTIGLQIFAAVLKPLVDLLVAVSDGFADVANVVGRIVGVFAQTVGAFVTALLPLGEIQDVIKEVQDAFHELVKAIVFTAARIALLFGAVDFVKKLRDSFASTGEKAAGPVAIKNLEQIGKDLAVASVNAAGPATEEKGFVDIVKGLDDLLANGVNIAETLKRIEAGINSIPGVKTASTVINEGGKFLDDPVGYVGDAAKKQLDKPGVLGYTSLRPSFLD